MIFDINFKKVEFLKLYEKRTNKSKIIRTFNLIRNPFLEIDDFL